MHLQPIFNSKIGWIASSFWCIVAIAKTLFVNIYDVYFVAPSNLNISRPTINDSETINLFNIKSLIKNVEVINPNINIIIPIKIYIFIT